MSYHKSQLRPQTIKRNNDRNNPNKKDNKKSYFDIQEERFGQSWLYQKNVNTMSKEIKSVVRDLLKLNINVELHAHYFLEHLILESLITEVGIQANRYWAFMVGMQNCMNYLSITGQSTHPYLTQALHESTILFNMYNKLLETCHKIKYEGNPNVHLFNLYNFLEKCDAKFFLDDDIHDYVRDNYMESDTFTEFKL